MDGDNIIYPAFMKEERVRFLLERFVSKSISQEELSELAEMMKDPQYQTVVEAFMDGRYEGLMMMKETDVNWENMYEKIIASKQRAKVYTMKHGRQRNAWRWIAAAVVLLVVGGLWFVVGRKASRQQGNETIAVKTKDVEPPKGTRAVIVLGDGRKVYLDSAGNGLLAQQDMVKVVRNENGEVVYSNAGTVSGEMVYNTMMNPRGSKVIPLTLNDGTKVWLNSESSIKYPIAFTGKERIVEVTGEAYFEVTHNAAKPFIVSVNDMQVEVLGTHFDINSYGDEGSMKTTLLEGKVRVTKNGSIAILNPGQQASAMGNGQINISSNVDIDKVMAWKDNRFYFQDDDVKTIMRQLERWYDIHVVYDDQISNQYTGIISRNVPVSKVLQLFEKTGDVKFSIEGNIVHVKAMK